MVSDDEISRHQIILSVTCHSHYPFEQTFTSVASGQV